VTAAGPGSALRVDVGAWFNLVFGVDGGAGSDDLCRPLLRRGDAFDTGTEDHPTVVIRIAVTIPDQDVARAVAAVQVTAAAPSLSLPSAAAGVVERSVASLLEAFRGLGGESSTAATAFTLRCHLAGEAGAMDTRP
jgi:hypothetical protein